MALNALNTFGGGGGGAGSFQNQGANVMSLLSGQQGQQMAARQAMLGGFQGGPTGAIRGILQAAGIEDEQGRTDPILGGLLQQAIFEQRRPQFDKIMSEADMARYRVGRSTSRLQWDRGSRYSGCKLPS